jgi:homoserine kinase
VLVLASDPAARLEAVEVVERRADAWHARLLAVDIRGGTVEAVPNNAAA